MTNPTWPIGPKENELVERVARAIDPVAFDTESRAGQKGYRYRAQRRRDAESNARAVIEALRPELEDAKRIDALQDIFIKGDEAHVLMCEGSGGEEICDHPAHPHFEAFAWNWRCDPVRGMTLREVIDKAIDAARQEGK